MKETKIKNHTITTEIYPDDQDFTVVKTTSIFTDNRNHLQTIQKTKFFKSYESAIKWAST